MSLSVSNINSDKKSHKYNQPRKTVQHAAAAIPMVGAKRKPAVVNKSNDGKFSFSEAAKNFGKGLISPITSMFESKKSFLKGALMIAGSVALVIATGGAATPVLIAAGVAMGAYQGAKGIHKAIKAKNGDDVEKAFYDIGAGAGTIGLSVAGAKGALKTAGFKTKGLNMFSATKKCITSSKSLTAECATTFKNGYYKTNVANFVNPLVKPRAFKKFSKELCKEGKAKFNECFEEVNAITPDKYKSTLVGRPKSQGSIYSKIVDGCDMTSRIKKVMARKDWTEAQKKAEVARLSAKEEQFKTDINAVREVVSDLQGTRNELAVAGKAEMAEYAKAIAKAISDRKIVITELRNYRGPKSDFYFSKAEVELIQSAATEKGIKLVVLEGKKQIKSSGYTAVQMKVMHKNGSFGEFQLRGQEVGKVAEYEHIPYDLRTGKDISKGSNKIGALLVPFKKAIGALTEEQYTMYESYLAATYRYARRAELGLKSRKVKLPEGFDEKLSVENLQKLHHETAALPEKEGATIAALPQSAVIYGLLMLTRDKQKENQQKK